MEYALHILILICIYIMLSGSLNLIVGYTGLLSLAHAAFFGIGAYVAALLAISFHTSALVSVLCAMTLSGILGGVVGIPTLRIRGDYFAVGTFAFQVLVFDVLNNWNSVTGGPLGVTGIPLPTGFGQVIASRQEYLIVIGIAAVCMYLIMYRIVRSPFGRTLKAIREDEIFAQSLGKNVASYKIAIFAIGAAIAGFAGALYAYYVSYIDPTSFTVIESIFVISIVIVGGAGSLWGPIIGSIILVALPELLRFVGLPGGFEANVRQIIYGVLLVAFVAWRPSGLVGDYGFQGRAMRE